MIHVKSFIFDFLPFGANKIDPCPCSCGWNKSRNKSHYRVHLWASNLPRDPNTSTWGYVLSICCVPEGRASALMSHQGRLNTALSILPKEEVSVSSNWF